MYNRCLDNFWIEKLIFFSFCMFKLVGGFFYVIRHMTLKKINRKGEKKLFVLSLKIWSK